MTRCASRLLAQLIRALEVRKCCQLIAVLRGSCGASVAGCDHCISREAAPSHARLRGRGAAAAAAALCHFMLRGGTWVRPTGRKWRGDRWQVPGPHAFHRWVGRRRKGAPEIHRRGAALAVSGPCAHASAVTLVRRLSCALWSVTEGRAPAVLLCRRTRPRSRRQTACCPR